MEDMNPIILPVKKEVNQKKILVILGVCGVCVIVILAITIPLATVGKNSKDTGGGPPTPVCSVGYTGIFCDEPLCQPYCIHGSCNEPNKCTCQSGWSGKACEIANCTMPCTVHGECTSPDTCTCESNWHGLTCEMPMAPGFTPTMEYCYNLTTRYVMNGELLMNNGTKYVQDRKFESVANVSFTVRTFTTDGSASIGIVVVKDVICVSTFDLEKSSTTENCDESTKTSLMTSRVAFLQNRTTGKIEHVYYNKSDGVIANFIARMLRFLDYETAQSPEITDMYTTFMKYPDGRRFPIEWKKLKSDAGMNCYFFSRNMTNNKTMVDDKEKKKVCMSKASGAPAEVTMSENFVIGESMHPKHFSITTEGDEDLSAIPTFTGQVNAHGVLTSMRQQLESESESVYREIKTWIRSDHVKMAPLDYFVLNHEDNEEEVKAEDLSMKLKDILYHPDKNLRLPLLKTFTQKHGVEYITNILFSKIPEINEFKESRPLLIAALGVSQALSGERALQRIITSKNFDENDHYLAMGAISQIHEPEYKTLQSMIEYPKHLRDSDAVSRAYLVIGTLGSKGFAEVVVKHFEDILRMSNTTDHQKALIITALGNTHSEIASSLLTRLIEIRNPFLNRLTIRSLRNIPGKVSYETVFKSLLRTREKQIAIQCINSLKYKLDRITNNDVLKLLDFTNNVHDLDVLQTLRTLLLQKERSQNCQSKRNSFRLHLSVIDKQIQRKQNARWHREIKREVQNFGVYIGAEINANTRGHEFDFNGEAYGDFKVLGRRSRLLKAGTANSFVNNKTFMSSVYLTLNLNGKEQDLFMRSWKFDFELGLVSGNPCNARNGLERSTQKEHFDILSFSFKFGIPKVANVELTFLVSADISLGYGMNVISVDKNMKAQQINAIVKPVVSASGTVTGDVNVILAKGGVSGSLDIVSGDIQANAALNIPQKTFCHFIGTNLRVLSGRLTVFAQVGVWRFKRTWRRNIFNWKGRKITGTQSESFCCANSSLASLDAQDVSYSESRLSDNSDGKLSLYAPLPKDLILLRRLHQCSKNSDLCSESFIQRFLKHQFHVFELGDAIEKMKENEILKNRHVYPILMSQFGYLFGVNKNGQIIAMRDVGGFKIVASSLLEFISTYAQNHIHSPRFDGNCYKPLNSIYTSIQVLNLRPYCPRMPGICENIRMGMIEHGDTLTYTENEDIVAFNKKDACQKFIREDGIKPPFCCEDYPFSFTLEGGKGASVIEINKNERLVKMEAFNKFVSASQIQGGDKFRVMA